MKKIVYLILVCFILFIIYYIYNINKNEKIIIKRPYWHFYNPKHSGNSKLLISGILKKDPESKMHVWIFREDFGFKEIPCFEPYGFYDWLPSKDEMLIADKKGIRILDTNNFSELINFGKNKGDLDLKSFAASPDGSKIAFLCFMKGKASAVSILEIEKNEMRIIAIYDFTDNYVNPFSSISWLPNGEEVLYVETHLKMSVKSESYTKNYASAKWYGDKIVALNVSNRRKRDIYFDGKNLFSYPSSSIMGDIAFIILNEKDADLMIIKSGEKIPKKITSNLSKYGGISWKNDGESIVFIDFNGQVKETKINK